MAVEYVEPIAGYREEVAAELRAYFGSISAAELSAEDDIFALGLVNSLRALEIVVHVERTYGISVEVEDLDLDNFRTAARAAAFIERKRSGNGQP